MREIRTQEGELRLAKPRSKAYFIVATKSSTQSTRAAISRSVEITFDIAKRNITLRERGLDFADAEVVFSGRHTVAEDARFPYPERRFISAGWLKNRVVVVVWTPTANGRRVISMRHSHAKEQARWLDALGGP